MSTEHSKKMRWWVFGALAIVLSLIGLRVFLSGPAVEWILRSACSTKLGYTPEYQESIYEGDRLVFKQVVLLDNRDCPEGGYRIEVQRLELDYRVNWLGQTIAADIRIVQPTVIAERKDPDCLPSIKWLDDDEEKLFLINGSITIEDGVMELVRSYGQDDNVHVYVSGEARFGEEVAGKFSVAFDDGPDEINSIDLSFQGTRGAVTAEALATQLNVKELHSITRFFAQEDRHAMIVREGTAEGRVSASLERGGLPIVDGDLTLLHPVFRSELFNCQAEFPSIHFQFTGFSPKNTVKYDDVIVTSQSLGDGSFKLFDGDKIKWHVDQLGVNILLTQGGLLEWDIQGVSFLGEDPSRFHLEGLVNNPGREDMSVQLRSRLASNLAEDVEVSFDWKWLDLERQSWGVRLVNLGPKEFGLGQAFLKTFHPGFSQIHFSDGQLSTELTLVGSPQLAEKVEIDAFSAENLLLDIVSVGARVSCKEIKGKGVIDLVGEQHKVDGDLDLQVDTGSLRFVGLYNQIWQFDNIQADIRVRDGVPERSELTGALSGLKGVVNLNWSSSDEMADLLFQGTARDLLSLFPPDLREELLPHFNDDALVLEAGLKWIEEGVRFEGLLKISNADRLQDRIRFGCDVEGMYQTLSGRSAAEVMAQTKRRQLEVLAIRRLMPLAAAPAAVLTSRQLKDSPGIYGLRAKNGWAQATDLPLDHYVGPFIFKESTDLSLSGLGDVELAFDQNKLTVRYNGSDVAINGPGLRIEVPRLGSRLDQAKQKRYPAVHFFDLSDKSHFGFIPIHNARYHEKEFDLWFTNADADVIVEGKKLHVTNIVTTNSEGMEFNGRIDLDYSSPEPKVFEVDIKTQKISASVDQVKKLFEKFNAMLLGLIPLNGQVVSPLNGGHLKLSFKPGNSKFEGHLSGALINGSIVSEDDQVAVENLAFNFFFDTEDNALTFTDVAGELRVGKDENMDRYKLRSRRAKVWDLPRSKMEFDLRIEDVMHDVVRLVGTAEADEKDSSLTHFTLDSDKTHFGRIYPHIQTLTVRNWSEPVEFVAHPEAELAALSDDLERMAKSGWLVAAHHETGFLKDLELKGRLKGKIQLDPQTQTFLYEGKGENVVFEGQTIKNATIQGKKRGDHWSIEQLQLDHISIATDLIQHPEYWDISFLGLRYGTSVLVGIEGKYLAAPRRFETKLKLLEIDLDRLKEFAFFKNTASQWSPTGVIRASGNLFIDFARIAGGYTVKADFDADFRNLFFGGFQLVNEHPIRCSFDSDRGIIVQDLTATVQRHAEDPNGIKMHVDQLDYISATREASFEGLHFRLPAKDLPQMMEYLQEQYPERVNEMMVRTLGNLKQEDDLVVKANLKMSPAYRSLKLMLEEGTYTIGETKHYLKQFILEYDPYELKACTQYRHLGRDYWISGRASASALNYGQIAVGDCYSSEKHVSSEQPLLLFWEWNDDKGLIIRRAEGRMDGIEVYLNQDESVDPADSISLKGEIHVDGKTLEPLLQEESAQLIRRWKLGSGYELHGLFSLSKKELGKLAFKGSLLGRDFHLFGYELKTLHADIDYTGEQLLINDFLIADTAGKIRVDQLELSRSRFNSWKLEMPLFLAEEFRPSLLTPLNKDPSGPKPLVIQKAELRDVQGNLSELDSITGHGELHFINPSKANLRNTLLAVPGEILARIGLTSDLMTPVVGSVHYDIKNARVNLHEFRDMYSEGRLSKFYLPDDNFVSHVDFDGNLNIRVKMKQYNLLFKIAELFTVSIMGTIDDPVFSLNKQQVTDADIEPSAPEKL